MRLLNIESFYTEYEGLIQVCAIVLAIVFGYISIVQPVIGYIKAQKNSNRDKRFENYHNLIDHLVGAHDIPQLKLDRQIAIVFELRRFPEYYPVTKRILIGIRQVAEKSSRQDINRIITEIDLTLSYINSSWIKRKFYLK